MVSNSLIDSAYTTIRQQILTCDIMPGQLLSIYKLSEDLNMSRTPISNAIARLELEGLVITLKNRGFLVKEISSKELIDMFDVNHAYQQYVVDRVQESLHYRFNLDELEAILQKQKQAKEQNAYLEYAGQSLAFNRCFLSAARNEVMLQTADSHQEKIIMASYAKYKRFPQQRLFTGLTYNETLFEQIKKQNYTGAREAMKTYYQMMRERIIMQG